MRGDGSARAVVERWLADYADAVDAADLLALARLCAGVTVAAPSGAQATGDEVADLYAPLVVSPSPQGQRHTKHHITNVSVHDVGEAGATARSYYLLLKERDGAPTLEATGRYETTLMLGEGGWAVTKHVVVRDMTRPTEKETSRDR